jgi:hypothetical protein
MQAVQVSLRQCIDLITLFAPISTPFNRLMSIFRCRHGRMGSPFTRDNETYCTCMSCGARRQFNVKSGRWLGHIIILLLAHFTIPSPLTVTAKRKVQMEKDNLLGMEVRIRRGWHGGRTGKVTVFDRHKGQASYVEIKVQLDGSGQIINIPSEEELEKLNELPVDSALQRR